MDGRPNRRNKAAFSNFSSVVRTGNKCQNCLVLRSLKYKVQLLIRTRNKSKRTFFSNLAIPNSAYTSGET